MTTLDVGSCRRQVFARQATVIAAILWSAACSSYVEPAAPPDSSGRDPATCVAGLACTATTASSSISYPWSFNDASPYNSAVQDERVIHRYSYETPTPNGVRRETDGSPLDRAFFIA